MGAESWKARRPEGVSTRCGDLRRSGRTRLDILWPRAPWLAYLNALTQTAPDRWDTNHLCGGF